MLSNSVSLVENKAKHNLMQFDHVGGDSYLFHSFLNHCFCWPFLLWKTRNKNIRRCYSSNCFLSEKIVLLANNHELAIKNSFRSIISTIESRPQLAVFQWAVKGKRKYVCTQLNTRLNRCTPARSISLLITFLLHIGCLSFDFESLPLSHHHHCHPWITLEHRRRCSSILPL